MQARLLWSTQLLIQFRELKLDDLYEFDEDQCSENRFKRELIGELDLNQIIWWDQTHCKHLVGGSSSTKNYLLLFKEIEVEKLI